MCLRLEWALLDVAAAFILAGSNQGDRSHCKLADGDDADGEENMEMLFLAPSQITENLSTPWYVLMGFFPSVEDELMLMGFLQVSTFAPAHRGV